MQLTTLTVGIIAPFVLTARNQPVLGSLYVYAPNHVAPIFFAVAFACSAVGHFWQC